MCFLIVRKLKWRKKSKSRKAKKRSMNGDPEMQIVDFE